MRGGSLRRDGGRAPRKGPPVCSSRHPAARPGARFGPFGRRTEPPASTGIEARPPAVGRTLDLTEHAACKVSENRAYWPSNAQVVEGLPHARGGLSAQPTRHHSPARLPRARGGLSMRLGSPTSAAVSSPRPRGSVRREPTQTSLCVGLPRARGGLSTVTPPRSSSRAFRHARGGQAMRRVSQPLTHVEQSLRIAPSSRPARTKSSRSGDQSLWPSHFSAPEILT